MDTKIPQTATLIGGYFLRLIMGIKITHPLSVLQPKVIVFTKGYIKTVRQQRGYTPYELPVPHIQFYISITSKKTVILYFSFRNLPKRIFCDYNIYKYKMQ